MKYLNDFLSRLFSIGYSVVVFIYISNVGQLSAISQILVYVSLLTLSKSAGLFGLETVILRYETTHIKYDKYTNIIFYIKSIVRYWGVGALLMLPGLNYIFSTVDFSIVIVIFLSFIFGSLINMIFAYIKAMGFQSVAWLLDGIVYQSIILISVYIYSLSGDLLYFFLSCGFMLFFVSILGLFSLFFHFKKHNIQYCGIDEGSRYSYIGRDNFISIITSWVVYRSGSVVFSILSYDFAVYLYELANKLVLPLSVIIQTLTQRMVVENIKTSIGALYQRTVKNIGYMAGFCLFYFGGLYLFWPIISKILNIDEMATDLPLYFYLMMSPYVLNYLLGLFIVVLYIKNNESNIRKYGVRSCIILLIGVFILSISGVLTPLGYVLLLSFVAAYREISLLLRAVSLIKE